jgi:hypothetical protein
MKRKFEMIENDIDGIDNNGIDEPMEIEAVENLSENLPTRRLSSRLMFWASGYGCKPAENLRPNNDRNEPPLGPLLMVSP